MQRYRVFGSCKSEFSRSAKVQQNKKLQRLFNFLRLALWQLAKITLFRDTDLSLGEVVASLIHSGCFIDHEMETNGEPKWMKKSLGGLLLKHGCFFGLERILRTMWMLKPSSYVWESKFVWGIILLDKAEVQQIPNVNLSTLTMQGVPMHIHFPMSHSGRDRKSSVLCIFAITDWVVRYISVLFVATVGKNTPVLSQSACQCIHLKTLIISEQLISCVNLFAKGNHTLSVYTGRKDHPLHKISSPLRHFPHK